MGHKININNYYQQEHWCFLRWGIYESLKARADNIGKTMCPSSKTSDKIEKEGEYHTRLILDAMGMTLEPSSEYEKLTTTEK